ncbi:sugar kinase [Jannaschia seohaensis]|uniref:2-dehydro-3-deoxygluconokinase n=1 Tax=Jannaschia seohaensis TaxID=475081 RepID=A0A2Y9ATD0_9RHOB|nr:sugar kinase [Jannaschia seohaensis]PWJ17534.1 2-dehydro-3-deoxygluconokinase [Jannaschia seohaensis]SSA47674.1 2-dehydro-3-deoxygluconokinase [Jannaschia seohaensis]
MRVLSIGECMAELAPAPNPGDYRLGFAGDTFNTAWYLARLGVAVEYLTAVGDDAISDRMLAAMQAGGVGTAHVARLPGSTVGLYLITLADGERSFSYWRGQSAARRLADDPARLTAAMAEADTIYLSGITLAILAPDARATLIAALDAARRHGATIAFDPNLRPRLWPDAASMTQAIMEMAARTDIALPSHEDEATWFGDADPAATAARYAEAGARLVVVKDGANPVLWRSPDADGTVPVAPVQDVVDTTAAGDSFNAGFLAGLAQGAPLPDAIARGCHLSAQVVQGRGALVETVPV